MSFYALYKTVLNKISTCHKCKTHNNSVQFLFINMLSQQPSEYK